MTKINIPTTSAELEEFVSDASKMEAITSEGRMGEFTKAYANAFAQKNKDWKNELQREVQLGLADFLKTQESDGVKPERKVNFNQTAGDKRNGLFNKRAPGAKVENEYEDAAEFFQAIWHKNKSLSNGKELQAKAARAQEITNSFGSTVPADGGFLVPETMRSELLQLSLESAVVRPRAFVIPMESLTTSIPMVDTTTNVGSVYGGITAYWTEEAAALTESQATFGRLKLEAKKLTAYAVAPNELVADATAFGAFIGQSFPGALSYFEDIAFLSGTGVGEPLGVLNSGNAAVVAVAKESGQAAATIVWENVIKMYSRMLPESLRTAVWVVSPDTFPEIATMALSVGTGGSAVWLTDGTGAPSLTLLGRPVVVSEKASVLGTLGDINFIDFSKYIIGDRQVMQADSSADFLFSSDKTAYRVISRVDGRPWLQSAITPQNNGPALSPYVSLATRA